VRSSRDFTCRQVAVALLDDVAKVDANAELDAALGRKAGVALDHAVLYLDSAANGIDHAPKLDDDAVAGAFHHAAVMQRDGGVEQIAS
jgi:hypothetical protein